MASESILSSHRLAMYFRWLARVLATVIVGMLILFAIGEKSLPPLNALTVALIVFLAGCLATWFSDRISAVLLLVGMAAFYIINVIATGKFRCGLFPLFLRRESAW